MLSRWMMDGELLAGQLSQLGRQLDDATSKLADLDVFATGAGIEAVRLKEEYEDDLAEAFLNASGSNAEARKAAARLACVDKRVKFQNAAAHWEQCKGRVRNQQAVIRALNARIDIGRSLLSREKSLAVIS